MSLDLNWSKCADTEKLNTEHERSLSFGIGCVMMFARIGKVTEETLPELVSWTRLLEMDTKLYWDGAQYTPLPVQIWIDRLGMTSNVGTDSVATRKTHMMNWLKDLGASEVRIAQEEQEA